MMLAPWKDRVRQTLTAARFIGGRRPTSPFRRIGAPLVFAGVCLPAGAFEVAEAQGSKVSSAVELATQADSLKPGQWVWAPEISPAGPVTVYVDLSRQLATVYRNGVRIAVTTVSSGKPGHETPVGVFTILQKDAKHRSSTYNNAPMPYQERLTWDGVALHAGGLPGYPESHGCVHLPYTFARELFGITEMGGTVVVAGRAGSPVRLAAAGALAPIVEGGAANAHFALAPGETYRWQPELAPEGPVSIVLSRRDQRVIVLRNGIEIGRSRAIVPVNDASTHVLTLTKGADGADHWIFVNVPGHAGEQGMPLDASVAATVKLPEAFRRDIQTVLSAGATAIITDAEVGAHTTGRQLTLLSGVPGQAPINQPE